MIKVWRYKRSGHAVQSRDILSLHTHLADKHQALHCNLHQTSGKHPHAEISQVYSFPLQSKSKMVEHDSAASTEHNQNLAVIPGLTSGWGNFPFPTIFAEVFSTYHEQLRTNSCSKGSSRWLLELFCQVYREECCKCGLDAISSKPGVLGPSWHPRFPGHREPLWCEACSLGSRMVGMVVKGGEWWAGCPRP